MAALAARPGPVWPPQECQQVVALSRVAPDLSLPARKLLVARFGLLTHPAVYGLPQAKLKAALRHQSREARKRACAEISAAIIAWGPAQ